MRHLVFIDSVLSNASVSIKPHSIKNHNIATFGGNCTQPLLAVNKSSF